MGLPFLPRSFPRTIKEYLKLKVVKPAVKPPVNPPPRKRIIESETKKTVSSTVSFEKGQYHIATSVLQKPEVTVRFYREGKANEKFSTAYRFFRRFAYLEMILTLTCAVAYLSYQAGGMAEQLTEQEKKQLNFSRKLTRELAEIDSTMRGGGDKVKD